jgi:hypothetical protein
MMTQGAMVFPVAICGGIEPSGHTKIFDTIRLKFPDEYRTPLSEWQRCMTYGET